MKVIYIKRNDKIVITIEADAENRRIEVKSSLKTDREAANDLVHALAAVAYASLENVMEIVIEDIN